MVNPWLRRFDEDSLGLAYPVQNLLWWVLFIRDELTAMYSQTRARTGAVYKRRDYGDVQGHEWDEVWTVARHLAPEHKKAWWGRG